MWRIWVWKQYPRHTDITPLQDLSQFNASVYNSVNLSRDVGEWWLRYNRG